jgi:type VI secretion system secreted protein Hcp
MAFEFYVTIEGTKQGKFKGESPREAHKEKLSGLSFDYGVDAPKDAATGQSSGKRTHRYVTFVKEVGASTPQIFQAVCSNEVIKSVLFEFIHTTPDGIEEVAHTIKLTNAAIAKFRMFTNNDSKNDEKFNVHELNEVHLTFQKIELDHKPGKTSAGDDWHAKS